VQDENIYQRADNECSQATSGIVRSQGPINRRWARSIGPTEGRVTLFIHDVWLCFDMVIVSY
ncbi:MAG TPA: hypothetical protein VED37_17275, partial [Ktedonobacteraceae bacterium]|nr:hypothetical protein [Ktedonobacteraceae bacterium]